MALTKGHRVNEPSSQLEGIWEGLGFVKVAEARFCEHEREPESSFTLEKVLEPVAHHMTGCSKMGKHGNTHLILVTHASLGKSASPMERGVLEEKKGGVCVRGKSGNRLEGMRGGSGKKGAGKRKYALRAGVVTRLRS